MRKRRYYQTRAVLTVPPQKWCHVYGTGLELFNPAEEEVTVTADLGGVSGLKLRLRRGDADEWIYIQQEEVNSDERR